MGRVRTKTIKRGAKILLEKYYLKLTNDFHTNKKILSEVGQVPTKKLRNKIAGFATHLMKRIQKGPVKGISLKVQEEERERRLDWVPTTSEISIDKVDVDSETLAMLNEKFGEGFLNSIRTHLNDKTAEAQPKKDRQQKGARKDGRGPKPPRRERPEKKEGAPAAEGAAPAAEGAATEGAPAQPRGERKERAPRAVRPAAKN